MPTIEFHFSAPNKLDYACRLLRKASAACCTVAVVGQERQLAQLDEQLWRFSPADFVAHGRVDKLSAEQLVMTPVWLCLNPQTGQGRQVLVNLAPQASVGYEEFERVIEVVASDEADRINGRLRWKFYTERGHAIVRRDLQLAS